MQRDQSKYVGAKNKRPPRVGRVASRVEHMALPQRELNPRPRLWPLSGEDNKEFP